MSVISAMIRPRQLRTGLPQQQRILRMLTGSARVCIGQVIGSEQRNGTHFLDVTLNETGETLRHIPLLKGGGTPTSFDHVAVPVERGVMNDATALPFAGPVDAPGDVNVCDLVDDLFVPVEPAGTVQAEFEAALPAPDETAAPQALLLVYGTEGGRGWAVAVMMLQHPTIDLGDPKEDPWGSTDRTDSGFRIDETVRALGGSAQIIDRFGSMTFTTERARQDGTVRYQLKPGSRFRISRDGNAGEAPTLGNRLVSYNQSLESKLAEVSARLETVITLMNASAGASPVLGPLLPIPAATATLPSITAAKVVSSAVAIPDQGQGDE